VSFGVIDIVRIAGGKAVEHWGQMDSMRMMQQLGVIPAPGAGEG
jgi:predicted ester cyclase